MTDARERVDALTDLESKQNVRLTLADGTTVAGRISQFDYTPEERLRVELSVAGENARYQARTTFGDGEWAPVEVRRYAIDAEDADWETLGEVTEVTPGDVPRGSEP